MVPISIKKVVWILPVLILFSCQLDQELMTPEEFNFKTGNETEIYFNNLRQPYYDREERDTGEIKIFRLQDRVKSASHPLLNMAIVMDNVQDEAYLELEYNHYFRNGESIKLIWNSELNRSDTLILNEYSKQEIINFASRLYNGLQKRAEFYIEKEGLKLPMLREEKERIALLITISDFLRLTKNF